MTVGIVVTDNASHAVASVPDAGFLGHVREAPRAVVAKEPVPGKRLLAGLQIARLHRIQVKVTVVVVVEEPYAASNDLGKPEALFKATHVDEIEAGLLADLLKPGRARRELRLGLGRRGRRVAGRLARASEHTEKNNQGEYGEAHVSVPC